MSALSTPRRSVLLVAAAVALVALASWGVLSAVGSSDQDVPGVPLPPSPFAGSLNDYSDFEDVYAIPLSYNERLDVAMSGDDGTNFDLWLWKPSTKSVHADNPLSKVVQSSQTPGTSAEGFWYPARSSGTYYLHVFNRLDTDTTTVGAYDIEYAITQLPAPALEVRAPSTVRWGRTASITGTVTVDSAPLPDVRVLVQYRAPGATGWKNLNFDKSAYQPTTVVDDAGHFRLTVKPSKTTEYRVVVWPTENTGWRHGAAFTIAPKVRLGAPKTPVTARRGVSFTAYGYLAPRHKAKARTVTLTFTKGARTVKARATNFNHYSATWSKSTRYRARVSLPAKGRWKVVASTKATKTHAATRSAARYITVR